MAGNWPGILALLTATLYFFIGTSGGRLIHLAVSAPLLSYLHQKAEKQSILSDLSNNLSIWRYLHHCYYSSGSISTIIIIVPAPEGWEVMQCVALSWRCILTIHLAVSAPFLLSHVPVPEGWEAARCVAVSARGSATPAASECGGWWWRGAAWKK